MARHHLVPRSHTQPLAEVVPVIVLKPDTQRKCRYCLISLYDTANLTRLKISMCASGGPTPTHNGPCPGETPAPLSGIRGVVRHLEKPEYRGKHGKATYSGCPYSHACCIFLTAQTSHLKQGASVLSCVSQHLAPATR